MNVTTRDLGNREVELTIEVDEKRLDQAMRNIVRRYARDVKIPGFRPGKVPYKVLAQRIGHERLLQEALEEIVPDLYQEALDQAGIEPYEIRPLEVTGYDPLTLTATVPLAVKVELGDYHQIRLERPPIEVTDEEVEEVLQEYREEFAELVPVERGAEIGDQVVVDLKIEVDGESIYDNTNVSLVLAPSRPTGVPEGFVEQLVGMQPGEERQFSLTYPEDYEDKELAGKTAHFTVVLHDVKARELPELDDEFAQTVGEIETLEELRSRVREILYNRAKADVDRELVDTLLDQLVEVSTVEYPAVALEQELERVKGEYQEDLQRRGQTVASYLRAMGLTEEEFEAQQREEAERRLKRRAILTEVIRQENIQVTDEEITEELQDLVSLYGDNETAFQTLMESAEGLRDSIVSRLLTQKAVDRLLAIATGESEPSSEEAEGPTSLAATAPPEGETGSEAEPSAAPEAAENLSEN